MNKLLFRLLVVSLCAIGGMSQALAAKRVALVIGNDAYEHVTKLQKAVNDAEAMGETLEAIGFKVQRARNIGRRDMNFQIQKFTAELEAGDEALFFFAGHGVEIHGRNYLLPTDIPQAVPGQENFVTAEAVPVDSILNRIRERGTRVSILVLDACQDNPFPKKGTRNLGGTRGLARMPAPEGSFIMYSAGVGQTALDRLAEGDPHRNSVFTRSLIPLLRLPGLSLTETARRVRRDVQQLARTVSHQQRPAYYDEITGSFFFAGRGTGKAPSKPRQSDELAVLKARLEAMEQQLQKQNSESGTKIAIIAPPEPSPPAVNRPSSLPVHQCDRLAAGPTDPQRVVDGVAFNAIQADDAVRVCRVAVDAHPGIERFVFQLGRALSKAGQYEEAVRNYRIAAGNGNIVAGFNLGVMLSNGRGIDRDEEEAVRLWRKSAVKGHIGSMYNLGWAYEKGSGVPKDGVKAASWVFKALRQGHVFGVKQFTTKGSVWSETFRRELQRLMKEHGVYSGSIDGQFGPSTKRAIRELAKQ